MSIANILARGYQLPQMDSPANALAQMYQLQGAQQRNALGQMELQAKREELAKAAELKALARGSVTPENRPGDGIGPVQEGVFDLNKYTQGLARIDPMQAMKLQAMMRKEEPQLMNVAPGGSIFDPRSRQTVFQAPFKPEAQKLPALAELQAYRDSLPKNDPRRREAQSVIDNQTRAPKYATPQVAPAAAAPAPKPLPASALKMVQEAMDRIGIASSVNADLAAVEKQINDGKLEFGPVSNLVNTGLNMTGLSTEESRNFATFKSTLERLRNESLRLNAGVQTDGDAQRAWNELFQNVNDTKLVQQRLREIQGINQRGAELQRLRADDVRANYGLPPVDASQYQTQPAAIGAPAPAANGGLTPAEQAELDQLRARFNKGR